MSKKIKNIFLNSPFKSVKHSSYFYAYEELFSDFVDKKFNDHKYNFKLNYETGW